MTWRTPVVVLAIAALVLVAVGVGKSYQEVLGGATTYLSPLTGTDKLTPLSTPIPTGAPTPTPTPTKKITPKPTPTPRSQPQFTSEQIYGFTEKYGILYAVDSNVIRHVIRCESGFNASAKNYIYVGLFQFDTRTWQTYRQKMGLDADPDLRYHAEEAIRTGTYVLSLGKTRLWPNCYPK